MNKILLAIISLCLFSPEILAQNKASLKGTRIRDEVIYLVLDSNKLEYFTGNQSADSRKNVSEKMRFSLKYNHCNLYIKWVNPLKYQFSFRDTLLIDERDKIISDFIKGLVARFGISVDTSGAAKLAKDFNVQLKEIAIRSGKPLLYIPESGFNDTGLTYLYLALLSNLDTLESGEIENINSITRLIEDLDKKNSVNIAGDISDIYQALFNLKNPVQARTSISLDSAQIEKYKSLYKEIKGLQELVISKIKDLKIRFNLLDSFTKTVITEFVYRTTQNLNSNKNLTSKIESVLDIIRKSLKDESVEKKTQGYFKIKSIEFDEGKILESSLQITEFKLNPVTPDRSGKGPIGNVTKANTIKKTMLFEKYDIIDIWASAGIFHSTASLVGYGISNNIGGQFTVSEDTIKRNSPVVALFLNFDFNIGSRYLAPLFQLGIDPTKKNPFMLLGGGFSIPSARFAITGGAIWTWNQSLDKLSVGQTISSTTELENDIKYEFDMKPKGWYLGIQYNF